jgi:hypothetical protein
MEERAHKLREEVAEMIASSTTTTSRLHLIDALERLCLDHLFEQEISAALAEIETADVSDWDLGTVALWFCLLRKHRYKISPGSIVLSLSQNRRRSRISRSQLFSTLTNYI